MGLFLREERMDNNTEDAESSIEGWAFTGLTFTHDDIHQQLADFNTRFIEMAARGQHLLTQLGCIAKYSPEYAIVDRAQRKIEQDLAALQAERQLYLNGADVANEIAAFTT